MQYARICRPYVLSICRSRATASLATAARGYANEQANEIKPGVQEDNAASRLERWTPSSMYTPDINVSRLGSIVDMMQREMEALTRTFFGKDSLSFGLHAPTHVEISRDRHFPGPATSSPRRLASDIREDEKAYILKADVPGMSREDIKVELEEDTLVVCTERKVEKEQEGEPAWVERPYGTFIRRVKLPHNVDPDGITASCQQGVLTVTIPKTGGQRKQPKVIPVQTAHDVTMAIREAQSLPL